MSTNTSATRRNGPRLPDTMNINNISIPIIPSTNEEDSIVAKNDSNDNHLVETDKNDDQADKDLTISQVEPSNEYESIIESRYLDYLDELEKTFHIVPVYEKKFKIIIKKSE